MATEGISSYPNFKQVTELPGAFAPGSYHFSRLSFQGLPHHFARILNRGMKADRQCLESLDKAGDDISLGSKFKRKKI